MGIVGTKKARVEGPVEIPKDPLEAKREEAKKRRAPDLYGGSQILSEGRFKKFQKRQSAQQKRRQVLIDQIRSVHKKAEKIPLHQEVQPKEPDMLKVRHQGMANKTTVVSNVAIVFNAEGIAEIKPINRAVYEVLIRQPGYQAYTTPVVRAPVPKRIAAPIEVATIFEEEEEGEEEEDLSFDSEYSEDDEEDEDEELAAPENLDFRAYNKPYLQQALEDAEVEFEAGALKSDLVEILEESWEDEDLRQIIFESLTQEEE